MGWKYNCIYLDLGHFFVVVECWKIPKKMFWQWGLSIHIVLLSVQDILHALLALFTYGKFLSQSHGIVDGFNVNLIDV